MSALRISCAPVAAVRSQVAVRAVHRCMPTTSATSSSQQVWQTVSCRQHATVSSVVVRAESDEYDYDPEMDCEERMEKSLVSCQTELGGFRTGAPAVGCSCVTELMVALPCQDHGSQCPRLHSA